MDIMGVSNGNGRGDGDNGGGDGRKRDCREGAACGGCGGGGGGRRNIGHTTGNEAINNRYPDRCWWCIIRRVRW